MTDIIQVTDVTESIIVTDASDSIAVTITEEVISVPNGVDAVEITTVTEAVNISTAIDAVSVTEEAVTIQPNVADVVINVTSIPEDTEMPFAKRVDFVGDTIIYKGEAAVGTVESASSWRVRRLTIATDDDVTEEWAAGTASFNKIWDDRASFTYT